MKTNPSPTIQKIIVQFREKYRFYHDPDGKRGLIKHGALEAFLTDKLQEVERETRKEVLSELKIGDLRQWLNEKPKDRLITDKDIRIMLGLDPK